MASAGYTTDFSSPFAAAAIVTSSGTRIPLWTNLDVDGRPTPVAVNVLKSWGLEALAWLTDVSVEVQLANLPIITLSLSPPYEEGLKFIDSPFIEWGVSTLEVQFGYTGGGGAMLSPVYSGVLLKPEIRVDQDIAITFHAQGVGAYHAYRKDCVETLDRTSRRGILHMLAERIEREGLTIQLDFSAVASGSISDTLLNEREQFSGGGRSYMACIYEVLNLCRCWLLEDGAAEDELGTLMSGNATKRARWRIIPRDAISRSEPKAVFTLYDIPNGQMGFGVGADRVQVFPMLGPTSDQMAVYLPAQTRGMFLQGYDKEKRAAKTVAMDADSAAVAHVGGRQGKVNPPSPDRADKGAFMPGDAADPAAVQAIQAEYQHYSNMMGIPLKWSSFGVPHILPGDVVRCTGLGRRISTNYMLLKVTHRVSVGEGIATELEAISNAAALGDYAPEAKGVNAQTPQTDNKVRMEARPG